MMETEKCTIMRCEKLVIAVKNVPSRLAWVISALGHFGQFGRLFRPDFFFFFLCVG